MHFLSTDVALHPLPQLSVVKLKSLLTLPFILLKLTLTKFIGDTKEQVIPLSLLTNELTSNAIISLHFLTVSTTLQLFLGSVYSSVPKLSGSSSVKTLPTSISIETVSNLVVV